VSGNLIGFVVAAFVGGGGDVGDVGGLVLLPAGVVTVFVGVDPVGFDAVDPAGLAGLLTPAAVGIAELLDAVAGPAVTGPAGLGALPMATVAVEVTVTDAESVAGEEQPVSRTSPRKAAARRFNEGLP